MSTDKAVTEDLMETLQDGKEGFEKGAEKLDDSKDPPLSPAGELRAARLAQMLTASGVKGIYTSQYRRTMQLAAPVARALNITPIVNPAGDTPGLLRKITAHGTDEADRRTAHTGKAL